MPKIIRIEDGEKTVLPLRVTVRASRKLRTGATKDPSLRVKCGCCKSHLEIYHGQEPADDPHRATLEINGVLGTLDQWRKILGPLLERGVPKI